MRNRVGVQWLAAAVVALLLATPRARCLAEGDAPSKTPAPKARLAVASDPQDAVVLIFTLDEVKKAGPGGSDTLAHGGRLEDRLERVLGRTPLDSEVLPGKAVIAIA